MTKPLRTWWHELNTWEPDAARAFYGRTLGWEFEKVALPDAAEYWIARKEGKPVGGVFDPQRARLCGHSFALDDLHGGRRYRPSRAGDSIRKRRDHAACNTRTWRCASSPS